MFHLIKQTKQKFSSKIECSPHTNIGLEPFGSISVAHLQRLMPYPILNYVAPFRANQSTLNKSRGVLKR